MQIYCIVCSMSELPTSEWLLNSTFSFIYIFSVTYKDLPALPPLAGNTTPVLLEKNHQLPPPKKPHQKNPTYIYIYICIHLEATTMANSLEEETQDYVLWTKRFFALCWHNFIKFS